MGDEDIHDIVAVPVAGFAQEGLGVVVVLVDVEGERPAAQVPARKGAGGGLDIVLGVVADAAGEQLHQLTGEVLVRVRLVVLVAVEVAHHLRVTRDGQGKGAEAAQGVLPEHLVLLVKLLPGHSAVLGGKMSMPEQGHFLDEGAR